MSNTLEISILETKPYGDKHAETEFLVLAEDSYASAILRFDSMDELGKQFTKESELLTHFINLDEFDSAITVMGDGTFRLDSVSCLIMKTPLIQDVVILD